MHIAVRYTFTTSYRMLQTKLDNVKIGFEFGHEIEVVEDGMK
jgi:hypothetical protein